MLMHYRLYYTVQYPINIQLIIVMRDRMQCCLHKKIQCLLKKLIITIIIKPASYAINSQLFWRQDYRLTGYF